MTAGPDLAGGRPGAPGASEVVWSWGSRSRRRGWGVESK